ncbi:MAG: flagellar assembly protein FliW [Alphaproteobacteria bacterium]|nr:MAG: flagellar assembly protein FliW [Alphaproteobacteria bacterium]
MTHSYQETKPLTVALPLGLFGFETIRAGGISANRHFCKHNIPIFTLHSEDTLFTLDILETNFHYYGEDIRHFINQLYPKAETDVTIFIPLCIQRTSSGARIMGNLRCPLILNNQTLCTHQLVLSASNLTMHGHLFTVHEPTLIQPDMYDA